MLFDDKEIQVLINKLVSYHTYIQSYKGNYTVVSKEEFDKEKVKESIKNHIPKKDNENLVMDNKEWGYNHL